VCYLVEEICTSGTNAAQDNVLEKEIQTIITCFLINLSAFEIVLKCSFFLFIKLANLPSHKLYADPRVWSAWCLDYMVLRRVGNAQRCLVGGNRRNSFGLDCFVPTRRTHGTWARSQWRRLYSASKE